MIDALTANHPRVALIDLIFGAHRSSPAEAKALREAFRRELPVVQRRLLDSVPIAGRNPFVLRRAPH